MNNTDKFNLWVNSLPKWIQYIFGGIVVILFWTAISCCRHYPFHSATILITAFIIWVNKDRFKSKKPKS